MYTMITRPESAPDRPVYLEVAFKSGDPVSINNKRLVPAQLLGRINSIAGEHGIGRVDIVENRYVGMKSRGVYETPGGTVLQGAHRALESIILDREVMHIRDSLIPRYSELIYYGYWFSPERVALQKLIDEIQKDVTGTVRLKLYKGSYSIVGRKSPHSLYSPELATFEADAIYNQKDAEGFIKLNALRLTLKKTREKR
jgi:argininosuccinate synthase